MQNMRMRTSKDGRVLITVLGQRQILHVLGGVSVRPCEHIDPAILLQVKLLDSLHLGSILIVMATATALLCIGVLTSSLRDNDKFSCENRGSQIRKIHAKRGCVTRRMRAY